MGLLVLFRAGAAQSPRLAPAAGHRPLARWRVAGPPRRRRRASNIVDPPGRPSNGRWRARSGPRRFWWIALGFVCALFAWYAVQVHQTKYLIEVGFSPIVAAWALGIVSVVGIPGQIGLGALSDRIGREWIWTAGCAGFAICYVA
jgi:hypothetical protein